MLQTGPGIAARVQVRDAQGQPRGGFATVGDGGTAPEASGYQLWNGTGAQVVRLGTGAVQDEGRTNLMFFDQEERRRLVVGVDAERNPGIWFYDASGQLTWVTSSLTPGWTVRLRTGTPEPLEVFAYRRRQGLGRLRVRVLRPDVPEADLRAMEQTRPQVSSNATM